MIKYFKSKMPKLSSNPFKPNTIHIVSQITGALIGLSIFIYSIYFGLYNMFICGISMFIDGCKMNPTNTYMIAEGAIRVLFFEAPIAIGASIGMFIFIGISSIGD